MSIIVRYRHAFPVEMPACTTTLIRPTVDNPADLATKIILAGQKRDHLVSLILYDIADDERLN